MPHVEVDVLVLDAAALVDLGQLGAGDDVAGGELAVVVRVAVFEHEPLAVLVVEDSALAADALGDEDAGRRQRRRVELDELHVLHRDAGAVRHRDAVAGVGDRIGGVIEHLPHPARREDDAVLRAEAANLTALDVVADDAVTGPLGGVVLVGDREIHHVPLVVHRNSAFDHLLVHRVEHLVARLRAGVRRPREGEPAERALGDAAVVLAGERHPPVFEPDVPPRGSLYRGPRPPGRPRGSPSPSSCRTRGPARSRRRVTPR
ncbi:hypothetical protein BN903_94 [Halorubrum sp. AJ67]|nr:hypothetical protein BN903_94 [Halorubrum sp. AJ67]